ncbi:hypothetical protein ES708_14526 [subsurface metagenome]
MKNYIKTLFNSEKLKKRLSYYFYIVRNFKTKYFNFAFFLLFGWIILLLVDYKYLVGNIEIMDIPIETQQELVMQIQFAFIIKSLFLGFLYYHILKNFFTYNLESNAANVYKLSNLGDNFHTSRFDKLFPFRIVFRHFLIANFAYICLISIVFIYTQFNDQTQIYADLITKSYFISLVLILCEWPIYRIFTNQGRKQIILNDVISKSIVRHINERNQSVKWIFLILLVLKVMQNIYHFLYYSRTKMIISPFLIFSRLFNNQIFLFLCVFLISKILLVLVDSIFFKWFKRKKNNKSDKIFSQIIRTALPKKNLRFFIIPLIFFTANLIYSFLLESDHTIMDLSALENPNYLYSKFNLLIGIYLIPFSLFYLMSPLFTQYKKNSASVFQKLLIFGMKEQDIKKKISLFYLKYFSIFLPLSTTNNHTNFIK